jgi:hypothetical protein
LCSDTFIVYFSFKAIGSSHNNIYRNTYRNSLYERYVDMPVDMLLWQTGPITSRLTCWWTNVRPWNELHAACACRHPRPWFHHPNNTRWSLLLRNFLQSSLDSNIFLSHFVFRCAFNLCSFKWKARFRNCIKQCSRQDYRFNVFASFSVLEERREDGNFWTESYHVFLAYICSFLQSGPDLRGAIGAVAPGPPQNRNGVHRFGHICISKIAKEKSVCIFSYYKK